MFFRGYVETKDKQCVEKFKGRTDFKTYEQVKSLPEFAGILAEDTILVDLDDGESSDVLFKVVQDYSLNCRVYRTTRGKHFLFKNSGVSGCKTHCTLAIGSDRVLIVEGKYDAARLANLVDATILTTDGFAIFKDKTMQALFKRIAAAQGMILLTDSDAAGFKIRHYITGLVGPQNVLQAYIPAVPGKEPRKPEPGKEGLLGVEGVDDALILQGLHTALAAAPLQAQQQNTDPITYTDLYEWGLSGSANASERRRTFLRILGLPPRLSKKEIIQVLNTLYTRDALQAQLEAMK